MTTVLLWLLVSAGSQYQSSASTAAPTQVVERFVDMEECERVRRLTLEVSNNGAGRLRCIQAKVYKP